VQFKEAVSDYDANSAAYAEWVKVDSPLMEAAILLTSIQRPYAAKEMR
jgi:hypothetical protein